MKRHPTGVNLHALDPASWSRLDSILDQVLDLPSDQLSSAIARLCAGNPELEEQVRLIVAADLTVQGYLSDAARREMVERAAAGDGHGAGPDGGRDAGSLEGKLFGPWRILRAVGQGGMGAVYLGERADGAFEQRVAIKLLGRGFGSPELLARFRQERQILARLEHPHIARLVDGGVTDDGLWWFAMEYVDGAPITEYATTRKLAPRAMLGLFQQVCQAVQYAHRNLVVHRDLKPSNIFVSTSGDVKLLDFGIAKILEPEPEPEGDPTLVTTAAMTPNYAAPEQLRGEPPTTTTDVYSLGVVLYELLTGERPYRVKTGSMEEVRRAVLEEEPEAPSVRARRKARERAGGASPSGGSPSGGRSSGGSEIPRELDAIVLTAIRKEPERRYASVEAFSEDIQRYLDGRAVRASGRRFGYLAAKFARRHRVPLAAAALVLIALFAGLFATARERDRARAEATRAGELKEFALGLFRVSNADEGRGSTLTARELLDRGAVRVEHDLHGNPHLQAEMYDLLGSVYRSLSLFPQSIAMHQRAVAVWRAQSLRPDTLLASSLRELGSSYNENGNYEEGTRVLREALAIERRVFGEVHPRVGLALGELAQIRSRMGHIEEAESLYHEAIRVDSLTIGMNTVNTASDIANLGMLHYTEGRYRQALPYIARALETRKRLLGMENQETATGLDQVGFALVGTGEVDSGLVFQRQALAIRRRVLPPNHPDVAHSLLNIGSSLNEVGRLKEAEEVLREGLGIRLRYLDPKDPTIAHTHNDLAVNFYRQRLLDSAEVHFREALRIWAFSLPMDHADVLTTRNNLAVIYRETGRYAESERMFREILPLRVRSAGGENSIDVALTRYHLGRLLVMAGRPKEGVPLLHKADAVRTAEFEADDPRVAEVRLTIGNALVAMGQRREGLALIRGNLDRAQIRLGPKDRMVVLARARLGKSAG